MSERLILPGYESTVKFDGNIVFIWELLDWGYSIGVQSAYEGLGLTNPEKNISPFKLKFSKSNIPKRSDAPDVGLGSIIVMGGKTNYIWNLLDFGYNVGVDEVYTRPDGYVSPWKLNFMTPKTQVDRSSLLDVIRAIPSDDKVQLPLTKFQVYNFGSVTREEVDQILRHLSGKNFPNNKREFYIKAVNIGIDIIKDQESIIREYINTLPSLEWEAENILAYTDVDDKTKRMVENYTGHGYKLINRQLRAGINNTDHLLIQNLIDKMPPLDKDIMVYRYSKMDDILPSLGDTTILGGYLSTSIDPNMVSYRICETMTPGSIGLMKIHVPKGARCIYIPGSESEFIFSNRSKLRLIKKEDGIICTVEGIKFDEDIKLYTFEMVN